MVTGNAPAVSAAAAPSMQGFWPRAALPSGVYMHLGGVGPNQAPAGEERIILGNAQYCFDTPTRGSILLERSCYRRLWELASERWTKGLEPLILGSPLSRYRREHFRVLCDVEVTRAESRG